jgi:hypothetical protein
LISRLLADLGDGMSGADYFLPVRVLIACVRRNHQTMWQLPRFPRIIFLTLCSGVHIRHHQSASPPAVQHNRLGHVVPAPGATVRRTRVSASVRSIFERSPRLN